MKLDNLGHVQRYCRQLIAYLRAGHVEPTPVLAAILNLVVVLAQEIATLRLDAEIRPHLARVFRAARDMEARRN